MNVPNSTVLLDMGKKRWINTLPELRKAIRKSKRVLIGVRFGCSEHQVQISKKEALLLIGQYPKGTTPHEAAMYTGSFGVVEGDDVYLG